MSWATLAEIAERTGLSEAAARSRLRRYIATLPTDRRPVAVKREKRTGGGNITLYSKAACMAVFGKAMEATDRRPTGDQAQPGALLEAKYKYVLQLAALQKKEIEALKQQQLASRQALVEATDRERFYMQTIERQQQQLAVYSVRLLEVKQAPPPAKVMPLAIWVAGAIVVITAIVAALYFAN